ncbi:hypothetical protein GCM10028805_10830 [Spirosoma harenae]
METQRKKLNPLAIRFAATELILATGGVTVTDVQNSLRRRGYEASQADVSEWLLIICFYESWNIKGNDQQRVYSFPRVAPTGQFVN